MTRPRRGYDPERHAEIKGFLKELEAAWLANPEQRFGQLVCNVSRDEPSGRVNSDTIWERRDPDWIAPLRGMWGATPPVEPERWVVHPGWVRSQSDGDRHFVSFGQLCRLYHIDPRRAIDASNRMWDLGMSFEQIAKLKHARVRIDGKYPDR